MQHVSVIEADGCLAKGAANMTKQGKRGPVKFEEPLYDVRTNFLGSVS